MRISDWSSDVCSSDLARRQSGGLRIDVWDTGPGIADEHRARVFEEFYQANCPPRSGERPGLGLGLATVQRLCALLEIPITLHSQRSEERRVGKECVSTCRSRWSPSH